MSSFGAASANPWVRVLDALEKKVNRTSYETWLKPTRYDHAQGAVLFVRVPNPEFCHIGERYGDLISEAMENLGLEFHDVEFVTEEEPQAKGKAVHADAVHSEPPAPTERPVAILPSNNASIGTAPLNLIPSTPSTISSPAPAISSLMLRRALSANIPLKPTTRSSSMVASAWARPT